MLDNYQFFIGKTLTTFIEQKRQKILSYHHEIFQQVSYNMQLQHTKTSYKSVAIYPEEVQLFRSIKANILITANEGPYATFYLLV